MIRTLLFTVLLLSMASQSFASGEKVRRPKAGDFGNVVINNYSEANKEFAVVFPHWIHRAKYSWRLCHVDIGFAMAAGGTGITEDDNNSGLFCGTCHNNEIAFGAVIDSKLHGQMNQCERCHSQGRKVKFQNNFNEFRKQMPRERFGNGIDWMTAEDQSKITLIDYLEGISFPRKKMKRQADFELTGTVKQMPKIIFSHEKHAKWNGCETCHPEIFPVKKGSQPYSMQQIFSGQYCGVCHDKVAFPNIDCQRCHVESVN
jgi:c(7)-type cytochrome triheme protein